MIACVLFDSALAPGLPSILGWSVLSGWVQFSVPLATAAALTLTLTLAFKKLLNSPAVITYPGGDPLLTGLNGLPVAPFSLVPAIIG